MLHDIEGVQSIEDKESIVNIIASITNYQNLVFWFCALADNLGYDDSSKALSMYSLELLSQDMPASCLKEETASEFLGKEWSGNILDISGVNTQQSD